VKAWADRSDDNRQRSLKNGIKVYVLFSQKGLTCICVYQRNDAAYYNINVKPLLLALKLLAESAVIFLLASRYGRMT
jgi:hypothetical protein